VSVTPADPETPISGALLLAEAAQGRLNAKTETRPTPVGLRRLA
jgi:hypothetical protein